VDRHSLVISPTTIRALHSLLSSDLETTYYSGLSVALPFLRTASLVQNVGYSMRIERTCGPGFAVEIPDGEVNDWCLKNVFFNEKREFQLNFTTDILYSASIAAVAFRAL